MVLNVFLVPNKLGYGVLASLFAARGNVGPPNFMIRAPNPLNIMWPLLYLTFGGILRLRAPTIWEGMAWFLPVRRTQKLVFEFLFIPPFLFI